MEKTDIVERREQARALYAGGMTQGEIARRMGVAVKTVSRYCRLKPEEVAVIGRRGPKRRLVGREREELARAIRRMPPGSMPHGLEHLRRLLRPILKGKLYSVSHTYKIWRELLAEANSLPLPPKQKLKSMRPKSNAELEADWMERQRLTKEGYLK